MTSTGLSGRFDVHAYNDLPAVEEADRDVRADSRLGEFLDGASRLILSYDLESRFGVSLLHKHNRCAPGERMIERDELHDDRPALVTRPSLADLDHELACPVVWQTRDGGYYPLEYSTDPTARGLLHDGAIPNQFLDDFRALTDRSPVGHLLGLAVVARSFYETAGPGESAIEFSMIEDRANVVYLHDHASLEGQLIETAWSFERGLTVALDCLKSCRRWCESIEGGHDKHHDSHHH